MNFDLTEDQREIQRTAREFLASRYTPETIRAIALDGAAGPALGRDRRARLAGRRRARDRRARGRRRGARLRARALAAGRALGGEAAAPGARGPRHGRDVGRGRRRRPRAPTLRADGSLTGVKIAVPNADVADTIVVTAEGGRHFAVPRADATIEPARALDTTRPLFTVRFDGAPGEELTGDHFGRAWHAIAVMAAAESVGVAARVTADDGRLRQGAQAVRPRDRLLPGRLARLRADVPRDRGRAQRHLLGRLGARPRPRSTAFMAANCAKAYASDAAVNVARSALQVHGGIGFTWEHDLHLFLKRAEANAHAFGDARWHREQVADPLLTTGSARRRRAWSRRRRSGRRRRDCSTSYTPFPPSGGSARRRALGRVVDASGPAPPSGSVTRARRA